MAEADHEVSEAYYEEVVYPTLRGSTFKKL